MNNQKVSIPEWYDHKNQFCNLGKHEWNVARLIQLSKDLIPFRIPLLHLNMYNTYNTLRLRDFVMHMKVVHAADLTCPIILDEDGELLDGRHRIMKALFLDHVDILAVRFNVNPSPDTVKDN